MVLYSAPESKFRTVDAIHALAVWTGLSDQRLGDERLRRVRMFASVNTSIPETVIEAFLTGKRVTVTDLNPSAEYPLATKVLEFGRVLSAATQMDWNESVARWCTTLAAWRFQPGAVNFLFEELYRITHFASERITPESIDLDEVKLDRDLLSPRNTGAFRYAAPGHGSGWTHGGVGGGGGGSGSFGAASSSSTASSSRPASAGGGKKGAYASLSSVLGSRCGEIIRRADEAKLSLSYLLGPDRVPPYARDAEFVRNAKQLVDSGRFDPKAIFGVEPAEWAEFRKRAAAKSF